MLLKLHVSNEGLPVMGWRSTQLIVGNAFSAVWFVLLVVRQIYIGAAGKFVRRRHTSVAICMYVLVVDGIISLVCSDGKRAGFDMFALHEYL